MRSKVLRAVRRKIKGTGGYTCGKFSRRRDCPVCCHGKEGAGICDQARPVLGRLHTLAQVHWPSSSDRPPLAPVQPQRAPLQAPAAFVAPFARQEEDVTEHLAISTAGAGASAAVDDVVTSDESEVHDDEDNTEMKDEAASKRPVYLVCNDNVWKTS